MICSYICNTRYSLYRSGEMQRMGDFFFNPITKCENVQVRVDGTERERQREEFLIKKLLHLTPHTHSTQQSCKYRKYRTDRHTQFTEYCTQCCR